MPIGACRGRVGRRPGVAGEVNNGYAHRHRRGPWPRGQTALHNLIINGYSTASTVHDLESVAASDGAAQPLMQNCAVFNSGGGFFTAGGWHAESGHNCTDLPSAPGAENRVGRSAGAQFASLTTGSED